MLHSSGLEMTWFKYAVSQAGLSRWGGVAECRRCRFAIIRAQLHVVGSEKQQVPLWARTDLYDR